MFLSFTASVQVSGGWIALSLGTKFGKGKQTLEQGLSTWALVTFWAGSFSVVRGCPVNCRVFSSIPDLHLLDARSTPPVPNYDIKKYKNASRQHQLSPVGSKSPSPFLVENHGLGALGTYGKVALPE